MFQIRKNIFETNSSTVHSIVFSSEDVIKNDIRCDVLKICMKDYEEYSPYLLTDFQSKIDYLFSLAIFCLFLDSDIDIYGEYDYVKKIEKIISCIEKDINVFLNSKPLTNKFGKKYGIDYNAEFEDFLNDAVKLIQCKQIILKGSPQIPHESVEYVSEFLSLRNVTLKDMLENDNIAINTDSCYTYNKFPLNKNPNIKTVTLNDIIKDINFKDDCLIFNNVKYKLNTNGINEFIDIISKKYAYNDSKKSTLCFLIGQKYANYLKENKND